MTPRRSAPGGRLGGCLPSSSCLLCLSGPPSAPLFKKIFDVGYFNSLWNFCNIASVLCFGFLAVGHVGS